MAESGRCSLFGDSDRRRGVERLAGDLMGADYHAAGMVFCYHFGDPLSCWGRARPSGWASGRA